MRRRIKLLKAAGMLCLAICCVLPFRGFPTRASGLFDDLLASTPEPEAGESAQGGGLFDDLLASTPEPEAGESAQGGGLFDDLLSEAAVAGDFEEQLAELTALFGAAEILEEADQTIVRFDVMLLSRSPAAPARWRRSPKSSASCLWGSWTRPVSSTT